MSSDPPLLAAVPPIRRARGFRLYDVRGRRYLDLYRDGALLGHREAGALTSMKGVLSQGLASPLPSVWERRLLGVLSRLFPGYPEVRLYASPERARAAVGAWLGVPAPTDAELHDPARDGRPRGASGGASAGAASPAAAAYWRPFLPAVSARALLPVLPVRVGGCPSPVCFDAEVPPRVPPSDVIPGFILAGALRGLAALGAPGSAGACPLSTPALDRALDAAPGWLRIGPYVTALFPETEYAGVHGEFLRAGVLLSPCCPGPSVLPGECSPGESRLLAELFTGIPGG